MNGIADRAKMIIAKHLKIPAEKVTESVSFSDLGADSLDGLELVLAFEDEFGCEIPDEVAETFRTPGDVLSYLEKNAKH
ncbi:MAG: acyl carrier protein [Pseudomonadota bacterium]